MCKNNANLYLVCLGGNYNGSNTEIHDIRWVVGSNINDTFKDLRLQWIGMQKGLHIDSYLKINFIDGYKIELNKGILNNSLINLDLWFINLGGYKLNNIYEFHEIKLVVASSKINAINKLKQKLKSANKKFHIDNLHRIGKKLLKTSSSKLVKPEIWQINILNDQFIRDQDIKPDWYGYKRIDKL